MITQQIIGSAFYRTVECNDSLEWAKQHTASAPDGSVFIAEKLTAARGRQGRTWQWAPGQVAVTILLKPTLLKNLNDQDRAENLNHLSMALCLGILEPLKIYGTGLKWPNDFYLAEKKIGGMLIEIVWQDGKPEAVILGFAINVNNHFNANHPLASIATSLQDEKNTAIDEQKILANFFTHLDAWYHTWLSKNNTFIFESWKKQQMFLGRKINIHCHDGSTISGILQDISPQGDAIIEHDDSFTTINFYQIFTITTR